MTKWYVGAMNDGLFIIDKPPSPSGTDYPRFDGPYEGLVIAMGGGDERTRLLAEKIVKAHNDDSN